MLAATINPLLSVQALTCVRGERLLFKNVSFDLMPGELLYLQGKNGSGKTTLLRTIVGLSHASHGAILWDAEAIASRAEDYYHQLLYIGHLTSLKDELTPVENLQFLLALNAYHVGRAEIINAMTQLDIARCADLPTRVLSQGQKRRVALAQLWLQDSPAETALWVLDEPFTALDASAVTLLTSQIVSYVKNGGMVVLTSHQAPVLSAITIKQLDLDQ